MTYRIDAAEVRRGLELLTPPVFELRCVKCKLKGEWRKGTFSGYFDRDHFDAVIEALGQIEHAGACYFTPNYVQPELLGRAYNRARIIDDKEPTTSDKDILERRWLLIDIDAVRRSGLSATVAEKAAAEGLATAVDYWLWERGFPAGIIGDSGNGAHVMIPLQPALPADDGGRIKRLLAGLDKEFSNSAATVDTTVFNAARIWKLPGTLVCKGDHAPSIGREWRMSRLIQICNEITEERHNASHG